MGITKSRLRPEVIAGLWAEYHATGDRAVRDKLALGLAPLVKHVVYRKVRELPASCEAEDFVAVGMEALLRCLDRYEPGRGASLEQFVWTRVQGAVVDEIRVVTVRDRSGRLCLLFPVTVSNLLGCRIASSPGGKHASFVTPLMAPDLSCVASREGIGSALAAAGRELDIDAFHFPAVPTVWNGTHNPLAAWGRPAANPAFSLRLSSSGDETLARSMSRDGRRKLRSKERRLSELGHVVFLRARESAETERLLEAFLHQKKVRFRELGIDDPFGSAEVRTFLRRGLQPGPRGSAPALELFALTLDDRPLAVLGAAVDESHLCGMFNSFDVEAAASRLSPGDILVSRLIRHACAEGLKTFDLGVGDARYKRTFCDETVPLADVVVPVTPRGRVFAVVQGVRVGAKRWLKASPAAMTALSAFRKARSAE